MFAKATQFRNVHEWNSDEPDTHPRMYARNLPPNFTDPTGMYQAGNPLDSLFGEYRAGPVQPAKKISAALAAGTQTLANFFPSTTANVLNATAALANSYFASASTSLLPHTATTIPRSTITTTQTSSIPPQSTISRAASRATPQFNYAPGGMVLAREFEAKYAPPGSNGFGQLSDSQRLELARTYTTNWGQPLEQSALPEWAKGMVLNRVGENSANSALAGAVRAITKEQSDTSHYLAVAGKDKQTYEERRFVENYESTAMGRDPFARMQVALDVAAAFAGGYTPTGTPLSARQPVQPQRGPNATNPPKVQGNSFEYLGETHVYVIRGPNGANKIGESMQGTRKSDGASMPGEAQARELSRKTGDVYKSRNTCDISRQAISIRVSNSIH